jgi:hypothetical protein
MSALRPGKMVRKIYLRWHYGKVASPSIHATNMTGMRLRRPNISSLAPVKCPQSLALDPNGPDRASVPREMGMKRVLKRRFAHPGGHATQLYSGHDGPTTAKSYQTPF